MPYILEPGGFGVCPLINTLKEIKIPTAVFFGEEDWVTIKEEDAKLVNFYIY